MTWVVLGLEKSRSGLRGERSKDPLPKMWLPLLMLNQNLPQNARHLIQGRGHPQPYPWTPSSDQTQVAFLPIKKWTALPTTICLYQGESQRHRCHQGDRCSNVVIAHLATAPTAEHIPGQGRHQLLGYLRSAVIGGQMQWRPAVAVRPVGRPRPHQRRHRRQVALPTRHVQRRPAVLVGLVHRRR